MKRMISWFLEPFSFESLEMKTSYYLFLKEVEVKLLTLIHALTTLTFVLITIAGIFLGISLREMLLRAGIVVSSLIAFLIRRRWPIVYKLAILSIGCGLMFYIMAYVVEIYKQPDNNNSFLTGNTMGMFEIMAVLSFKTLRFRTFSYVTLFVLKICLIYQDLFKQPVVYLHFLAGIAEVFFFCVYHDVLDRRNFAIIYKASEKIKKFQALLSNDLPSSVMIMSSNFESILYSNKFFQQKFTPEGTVESAGKVINDLFGKLILQVEEKDIKLPELQLQTSLLDYLIEMATQNLDIQETRQEQEVKTLYASHKDEEGSEVHYEVRLRKIMWDGKHSYAIVMNDITDKQLVTALKIADIQKDRVIATVSHELRTPINGIVGLLEMALELANDKTLVSYLENCKSCSKLLLYLVNAILDLSQIRNNSLKIVKNTFSLTEMLEEVRSLYIFQSHQKGIEFLIEKDPAINDEIYTDKYRLIEVLINLLGNAMKFTFSGFVKLKISKSSQRNGALHFCVEDTGLGIMEKDKAKLFKMFGKIEQANKNINTHGAGLGLTIANELVKVLNANHSQEEKIMFESEYNKGSKFWFEMSVVQPLETNIFTPNKSLRINSLSDTPNSQDFVEFLDPSYRACVKFEKRSPRTHFRFEAGPFHSLSKEEDDSFISPTTQQDSSPRHVLLVDDNPLNLMAAGFMLEKLKFSVTKALNGQEGIKKLEESVKSNNRYSIVLTDIQMPVMDGLEMSKRIKDKIQKLELYPVPIIALTAKTLDAKEHETCKQNGITCSLEKPLMKCEIEKVINNLLLQDSPKLTREE